MARRTKREEARLRGLVTRLGCRTEGEVEQLSIKDAWIRRRVVEGRYHGMQGEVPQPMDVFDMWLNDPPHWRRDDTGRLLPPQDDGALREPERHASSAHEA